MKTRSQTQKMERYLEKKSLQGDLSWCPWFHQKMLDLMVTLKYILTYPKSLDLVEAHSC